MALHVVVVAPEPRPQSTGEEHYYLFLSRVAMGTVHFTKQPLQNARLAPDGCDSVLGKTGQHKYTEYVVYDRAQAYPEFLVVYKREFRP